MADVIGIVTMIRSAVNLFYLLMVKPKQTMRILFIALFVVVGLKKRIINMTAYLKGKARGQVTEILMNGRVYEEEEIREALKKIPAKKKGDK